MYGAPDAYACRLLIVLKPRAARATFLDLPGELRNQIYAYSIYPDLSSIFVANCTKPEHFGATILHLPIFRTCRQIRAETLSYLCATLQLGFLGIHSAVLFFSLAGKAASEIKSLFLIEPLCIGEEYTESKETVEQFLRALEAMRELSEIQVNNIGRLTPPDQKTWFWKFTKRLEKLQERRENLRFRSAWPDG
ncbi:hypothetical protein COCMIDRAFT_29141 [Bipolaris oryzae ATCC 44560]|uniref:Uncharacterized protein n=1 Tax=Bipolaris oryzae ATCC 44560 TaxID=930090 RepID=W6ZFH9_COCMI|nr:uncharacterized protein COCMIDRAFT_29141 [Bipolaris oryzae ATCC 44560]EUC42226.1 hypothetical protein COCMIDRAFT_29141 [Bipolaris oryzae ATCC 44560]